ncbi:CapA family protein [Halopiger aswanensis]|uniref:Secreted protein n=1 Tax=Halopiger aswanensis TaxID=148449 RepID=A0A3R7HKY1_9EURY|nr:CapA family protein [Halopiger aswanensis]RKD98167.1 secreted protein [Halopiger aswanensis]
MKDRRLNRRQFLGTVGVGVASGVAGCGYLEQREETATERERPIEGVVRSVGGDPIASASVAVRAPTASDEPNPTSTDGDGRFSLEASGPVQLTVRQDGYNSRVRAVAPGETPEIRLAEDDAVSMAFGGDVMFGRRYYDAPEDDLRPRFQLDPDDRLASHRELLADVAPYFRATDIGSINLETSLTTTEWCHPSKAYTFTGHPVAAEALADAGIDYAALGNNHIFDALEPGLKETLETLEAADIAHSGAGENSDAAWEPALVERGGTTVAFLSCTTVVGGGYDIDWSADRNPDRTHEVEPQEGVDADSSLQLSGAMGAAEPTPERLRTAAERAADAADLVVVQIHGGTQYVREPTDEMVALIDAAIDGGADLVVNHHPHVTGGVERRDGALVAWTLGNLVFDQQFWATLRSFVLTVDVDESGIVRANTEPVVIQGYKPQPATGRSRQRLARRTAALADDPFGLTADGVRTVGSEPDSSTETVSGDGELFRIVDGWVADVSGDGTVRFGRDRLRFGSFRNELVTESPVEGPLWRFGRSHAAVSPDLAPGDVPRSPVNALELERSADNSYRAMLSPRHRIPISGAPLVLTGCYRFDGADELEVQLSWYDDTSGESFDQTRYSPDGTEGDWHRFRYDLEPPADAEYVMPYSFLSPPESGDVTVRVTDLRLVELADEPTPGADHLLVDGATTVELAQYPGTDSGETELEPLEDPGES